MASPLAGRRVVLGVTGGIAAYKAVELLRLLTAQGARVTPVLTAEAERFVGAVTFGALAGEPARTSLWDDPADPIPHTSIGQAADAVIVAPATAHLIGRLANGLADDLLTNVLLATRAPIVLAPAMHTEMWEQPSVQANVETLRGRAVQIVEPESGPLAGGDVGIGRMAEPAAILAAVREALGRGPLSGHRVLVTAGGTRESIDAVRFVGNRSSGRMGHAVAAAAARRGAAVVLVTAAPLSEPPGLEECVRVETAEEMERAVLGHFPECDAVVMAAAVADFRPKSPWSRKLKKTEGIPEVVLEPTTDILAELGRRKEGQVLVGFAAETATGEALAAAGTAKVRSKRLDLLVANEVGVDDSGFGAETNRAMLCTDAGAESLPLMSKDDLAVLICERLAHLLGERGIGPRTANS